MPSPRGKTSALAYLELEPPCVDDVDAVEYQGMPYMNWSDQVNTAMDDQVPAQQNDDSDRTPRASPTIIVTPPQPRLVPRKLEQEDEIPEDLCLIGSVRKASGTNQSSERDKIVISSGYLFHCVLEDHHTNFLALEMDEEPKTSLEPLDLPVLNW